MHLIGLELNVSVLAVALLGRPTGSTTGFRGDVVAVAKRDLRAGERLDGEGGYCAWGRLCPAVASVEKGWLPIGLAVDVPVVRNVRAGETICVADVEPGDNAAWEARTEMLRQLDGRKP